MKKTNTTSWLGWINIVIFQWMCIRLARMVDPDRNDAHVGWCLIGPVLPLTGWWSGYIGRARSFMILSQCDPICKDARR